MLTSVEVRNAQGDLLTLPLDDAESGFIVEEIGGLDPVKATLVSSSFANQDGEQYHSSRREARNIKMKLGLEPDYVNQTVRGLRKILYSFLMPKALVTLRFYMADGLYVDIAGRVESNEAPLFTAEPAVDVSLMCFDPDFIDPNPVTVSAASTALATETPIEYEGSVETGIEVVINVNRTLNEFTLYHRPPDGSIRQLDFVYSLVAGDVLRISTVSGAKRIELTRDGVTSSALYGMSPQSNWIELQEGENNLRLYAAGAAIPYTITYTTKYGGL